jgi:hypothetical protein
MNLAPWDEPRLARDAEPTLFEGGVHLVDLLLHLHGEVPAGVYARHSSGLDASRQADAIHLVRSTSPTAGRTDHDRPPLPAGALGRARADCERASLRASRRPGALSRRRQARPEDRDPHRVRARRRCVDGTGLGRTTRGTRATTASTGRPLLAQILLPSGEPGAAGERPRGPRRAARDRGRCLPLGRDSERIAL